VKLKSQLIISIAILGVILLIISASVIITNQQAVKITDEQQTAGQIQTGASNLAYISNDYFLYQDNAQVNQWQTQFSAISTDLSKINSVNPEQATLVNNVETDLQLAGAGFNNSVTLVESAPQNGQVPTSLKTVSDQLAVENQALAYAAYVLSNSFENQANQLKQTNNILIFTLLGAFAAYFVMIYLLVFRRTFRSITKLQEGTKIIGSGNLDYAIASKSNDEVGELSQAFNQMTTNLKTVTASKTDLERAEASLRASEQRWATTLSSIGDAVIATNTLGNITFMNSEAEELTGWTLSEASLKPINEVFNIVNEQSRVEVENPVSKVLEKGMIVGLANHTVLIRKNKTEVAIDDSGAPIKDKDGKTTGVVLIFRDITERKKAEEELKDSGERLQHALEAGELGLWGLDVITGKAWRTLQHDKIFGYNSLLPEWTYQMFLSHVLPEDRAMVDEQLGGAISKGTEWNFECRIQRHDGQQRWIWAQGKPKFDEKHAVAQMIGLVKDITERKKTEEALNKLNEELEEKVLKRTKDVSAERQRLYNVLETLPAYVVLLDKDYCVPFANKVFRERFGESHGRRCYDFLFKRESPCENCETYKVLKTNGPHRWEWTGPDGRDYDIYDFPFVEADGSTLILEMGIDITERKRAEKQIRDVSLYSRSLIEASLDPLVTISAEGKITDVNQATELATGCSREELIGSDFSDYFTEPEKAKIGYKQVFSEGFVRDYPLAIKHKSGKITEVLYNATIYTNEAGEMQGVFAAARDVTELKKAEEQAQESAKKLKDSERLAAIGATAGMVGHDIRNPLQAITGDLYLAKTELAALPENEQKISALESLDEIEHNIDYINKIVADLQDYARPLNPRAQETNIKSVFNEILSKNGIPKNINVTVDIDGKAEKIMADPDYIKRVAANLTLNAIQAMPDGGKLTIRAYCDKQTNDIVITVKDNGVGIPENIKPKLFTPMMTTKSKGQGFGLAVVKRMTEGLGGTVTFESTEGKGTTFIVRLPPQRS